MDHSALALFAQRTRIATSARSIGFCVVWVCISSSSSSASAKAAARVLAATEQVHEADIERKNEVENACGGDDEEEDDTDEDQVSL